MIIRVMILIIIKSIEEKIFKKKMIKLKLMNNSKHKKSILIKFKHLWLSLNNMNKLNKKNNVGKHLIMKKIFDLYLINILVY